MSHTEDLKRRKLQLKVAAQYNRSKFITDEQLADFQRRQSLQAMQVIESLGGHHTQEGSTTSPALAPSATPSTTPLLHATSTHNATTHGGSSSSSSRSSRKQGKAKKRRKKSHSHATFVGGLDAMWGQPGSSCAAGVTSQLPCDYCQQTFVNTQGLSSHVQVPTGALGVCAWVRCAAACASWSLTQRQHTCRYFLKTGMLLTVSGAGDNLMEFEGAPPDFRASVPAPTADAPGSAPAQVASASASASGGGAGGGAGVRAGDGLAGPPMVSPPMMTQQLAVVPASSWKIWKQILKARWHL